MDAEVKRISEECGRVRRRSRPSRRVDELYTTSTSTEDVNGRLYFDIEESAEMAVMTYREALNQALAEEMERDPDVFLMGEEVGRLQRRLQGVEGAAGRFGEMRVVDTPITELGLRRAGRGRGDGRGCGR